MIDFTTFKHALTFLQSRDNFAKELDEIFQKYDYQTDWISGYGFIDDAANNIILEILEKIFNDKNGWIEYWIYELNSGKNWEPGVVIDTDGKDIKLQTIEDLWNILHVYMVDGEL